MSVNNPTCPENCTTQLPPLEHNYCAPKFFYAEIRKIFITTEDAGGLVDVTSLTEWNTRLTNTVVGADDIRYMDVIGSLEAPEETEIELSLDRKVMSYKTFTLGFKVDDISDLNYEFMRTWACGGIYRIWFETAGGKIFGGNDGILAQLKGNIIIPESSEEVMYIDGMATWKSKYNPEMHDSPFV